MSPPTHPTGPQAPSTSASVSGGPSSHASSSLVENEIQKRARPLPVLTVLITDERGPYPDYLLAEVRVPLKHAERQEDGWWADAKDVCEKLQSSPSRIDGPAKVYTLRGKFRQFFLKVSADNKDEWQSANLVVSSQRTLDVFIESPYPPGHYRPSPSREYADSSAPNRQGFTSPQQSHHVEQDSRRATTSSHASPDGHRQHKRRRSPSFDNYSVAASPAPRSPRSRSTLSPSYREGPRESSFGPPRRHRPYPPNPHPLDLRRDISDDDSDDDDVPPPPPRGFHTPGPDADEDEIHEMVSKSISPLLEDDPSWPDFFRWKAMPQTAAMVLKQYQWVKQKMDEWNGKTAPLRSRRFSIEDTHVLAALQLNDKWGQSCKETLSLLELYGPEGTRLQDPTAKAILEDNSPPTYNAKPIKRLLHRLQEVHADYLKERPLVAQSNDEETETVPDQH
ncbi:hypothetical protein ONZ45_g17283 [Pleurotus djamor]|nr:hypothetical protein ONZ45_g17283 [Pleurotus djamor]